MPPKSTKQREIDLKKQEVNTLESKISEVESSLKEEKKVNFRLRSDVEKKIQQLMATEESIAREQERFRWQREEILSNTVNVSEKSEHRLKQLSDRYNDISIRCAAFDIIQAENDRLHKQLKDAAFEHYNLSKQQKQERETRKQKNFDTRMIMEQILRKTLKAVDKEYEESAVSSGRITY